MAVVSINQLIIRQTASAECCHLSFASLANRHSCSLLFLWKTVYKHILSYTCCQFNGRHGHEGHATRRMRCAGRGSKHVSSIPDDPNGTSSGSCDEAALGWLQHLALEKQPCIFYTPIRKGIAQMIAPVTSAPWLQDFVLLARAFQCSRLWRFCSQELLETLQKVWYPRA